VSLIASAQPADSFLEADALEDAAALLEDADSDSLIGHEVGHYLIEKQLGSGGMGEVYLAQDVRLGRSVALKLLDPGLTGDSPTRTRFLREARLASALDHANICTIHEVGEAADRLFIAMQYVEGETLRRVIDGRALSLDSLLSIGLQVADALAAAHSQGIVHRDIKPANIIITSRGTGEGARLRVGKTAGASGGRRRDAPDDDRRSDGHARVHVARASPRRVGGSAQRRVLIRRGPVRDGDRAHPL